MMNLNDPSVQIGRALVMHRQFKEAHDGIITLAQYAAASGVPFGATVLATSGMGKNTLADSIVSRIGSADLFGERARALHLSLQATPSIGQLIGSMLTQLGFPPVVRPTRIYEQADDLIKAIKEQQTRIIFLNEIQHLVGGRRERSAATITDFLKGVIEATNVAVVLTGVPALGSLRDVNEQLFSRAPSSFPMSEFKQDEEWEGLLVGVARQCTAVNLRIVHGRLARAMHRATGGVLRPLKQLLIAAARDAQRRGLDEVDEAALHAAYRLVFFCVNSQANPFRAAP